MSSKVVTVKKNETHIFLQGDYTIRELFLIILKLIEDHTFL